MTQSRDTEVGQAKCTYARSQACLSLRQTQPFVLQKRPQVSEVPTPAVPRAWHDLEVRPCVRQTAHNLVCPRCHTQDCPWGRCFILACLRSSELPSNPALEPPLRSPVLLRSVLWKCFIYWSINVCCVLTRLNTITSWMQNGFFIFLSL